MRQGVKILAGWSACVSLIFCKFLVSASRIVLGELRPLTTPPPPPSMGLVYLRPQDKFPPRYKTLHSNICLQSLEFCFTENKVSAHTSSTVFRTSVHTLISFRFKTRAFHCMKKSSAIWKHIFTFTLSMARNVSWDSVTKFKPLVLCTHFHIFSNDHSGTTQYT
jgi:hypothetical protein